MQAHCQPGPLMPHTTASTQMEGEGEQGRGSPTLAANHPQVLQRGLPPPSQP